MQLIFTWYVYLGKKFNLDSYNFYLFYLEFLTPGGCVLCKQSFPCTEEIIITSHRLSRKHVERRQAYFNGSMWNSTFQRSHESESKIIYLSFDPAPRVSPLAIIDDISYEVFYMRYTRRNSKVEVCLTFRNRELHYTFNCIKV